MNREDVLVVMQVRWSPQAAEDLAGIVQHIRRDSPDAAQRTARTIYERAQGLSKFPNLEKAGRLKGTRELAVPQLPFILVYRVRDRVVEINYSAWGTTVALAN
jgi:toxin ParE1/3/4